MAYQGEKIGRVEAIWNSRAIYVYAYALFALVMILAVFHLYVRILGSREEIKTQKRFTDNVIDSLPDTFYIFDSESGKGIQWNKTLNEISGYNYKEMSEYPPLHFYPPEEHQFIEEVVKTTLEKGHGTVELNYIIADGTRIPFEYATVLIKNAEGKPCICAIGRDITVRKRAEKEILL